MINSQQSESLPKPVQQLLSTVRQLLHRYVSIHGLLLIGCWLLVVFWLGAAIDYLPVKVGSSESPKWLRVGLLGLMAGGSLVIAYRWILRRWFARLPDRSIALLVERQYPELNNELVTIVELSRSTSPQDVSREEIDGDEDYAVSNPQAYASMLGRVRSSIERDVTKVDPNSLFNWQPIWALGTAFALAILMTLVAAVGLPDWFGLWGKRLFALSDQAWPRAAMLRADGIQLQFPNFSGQLSAQRTMLPFVDGLVRVPAGSAAMLQIAADTNAPRVPDVCTMFYQSADGAGGRANLRRVGAPRDGWQQFTLDGPPLDGLSSNITLDVIGLDARLRDLRLEIVDPVIVTNMQLDCTYPGYLQDELSSRPANEQIDYRAGLRIPQGTGLVLMGTASDELSRVEYLVREAGASSTSIATGGSSQTESSSSGEVRSNASIDSLSEATPEIRLVEAEGSDFKIDLGELKNSKIVEVRLIDQYGLSAEQILRFAVSVLEDTEPEVDATLLGIGTAITPNAILPVRGTVIDDNAVASVTALLAANEQESVSIPVELTAEGELASDIDLEQLSSSNQLSLTPESTLGIVLSARDYFNLTSEPHIGTGSPQQLAVVTPDQLLVILDRQELELRQRFELIINELQQMQTGLQSLAEDLELAGAETAELKLRKSDQGLANATLSSPPAAIPGLLQPNQQDDQADQAAQARRLAIIRAQQSQLQCDKSEQELQGVASRVENIRLQLVNNRIDSYDRQQRLQSKVFEPLTAVLNSDYQDLNRNMAELQSATLSGGGSQQCQATLDALSLVLSSLEEIKSNMLDIESFNEIIDLVRTLVEDQEEIASETEKQQKARLLDFLK